MIFSNTTPFIALCAIGRLQLLPALFEPETLDTSVLAAAVAPDAERADMIDPLIELDTKAADPPEKKDASGKVTHED